MLTAPAGGGITTDPLTLLPAYDYSNTTTTFTAAFPGVEAFGQAVLSDDGQFVAFNAYLTMLSWPMIAFGWVTNMLQRGMASWKRMLEVLDTVPSIRDEPGTGLGPHPTETRPHFRGEIEFRDLTFAYPGGAPVLEGFDLTIPAGSSLAIVGQNGAGKTTLAKLLCRLYDPQSGAIEIDGADLRDFDLTSWRSRLTAVFQDFTRFELPLRDNVAPAGAPDEAITTKASTKPSKPMLI